MVRSEGALKLKEISYIHAEGYPAGEMKQGPNALIDETLPCVSIATRDPNNPSSVLKYEKTFSNIQEVTARSGRIIAIEGDTHLSQLVEDVIHIPAAPRTPPPHPGSSHPLTSSPTHSRPPRLSRRPAKTSGQECYGTDVHSREQLDATILTLNNAYFGAYNACDSGPYKVISVSNRYTVDV